MRKDEDEEKIMFEDVLNEFLKDSLRGRMIEWDVFTRNERISKEERMEETYLDRIKADISSAQSQLGIVYEHLIDKQPNLIAIAYMLGSINVILDEIRVAANRMEDE